MERISGLLALPSLMVRVLVLVAGGTGRASDAVVLKLDEENPVRILWSRRGLRPAHGHAAFTAVAQRGHRAGCSCPGRTAVQSVSTDGQNCGTLLLGCRANDIVEIETPDGAVRVTLLDVREHHNATVLIERDGLSKERSLRTSAPVNIQLSGGAVRVELELV